MNQYVVKVKLNDGTHDSWTYDADSLEEVWDLLEDVEGDYDYVTSIWLKGERVFSS